MYTAPKNDFIDLIMATNTQFELAYEDVLAADIFEQTALDEDVVKLCDVQDLQGPISSISVSAAKTETGRHYGQMHLHTELEIYDPFVDVRRISEGFISHSQESKSIEVRSQPRATLTRGIVAFGSFRRGDARSFISPLLGGGLWVISSTHEHYNDDEEDARQSISRLLGHHVLAANTLVQTISGLYVPEGISEPEGNIYLSINPAHETDGYEETQLSESQDSFDSFLGIESTVDQLRNMVRLANTPLETLRANDVELIQVVLLHGPSGVGKSALIDALGVELGVEGDDIKYIKLSDVSGSTTGQWATNVDVVFNDAIEHEGRILIVLDEMDGLVTNGNEGSTGNITAVLKRQLEEIKKFPHVFVAGATNKIEAIDPDILAHKRIPLKLPIEKPTEGTRANIFRLLLSGDAECEIEDFETYEDVVTVFETEPDLGTNNTLDFDDLGVKTPGFSGGDIVEVVKQAKRQRFLDSPDIDPSTPLTQDELLRAIQQARNTKA